MGIRIDRGVILRGNSPKERDCISRRLLKNGIFVAPFEQGEIGPDLFEAACNMALRAWCRSELTDPIAPDGRRTGSRSRTAGIRRTGG